MNNEQRQRIKAMYEKLSEFEADLEEMAEQEGEKADNQEEHFGESEKGDVLRNAADTLSEVPSLLYDAREQLEEFLPE